MKTIENTQEFTDVLSQDKPVLLDFYADWCGPCQSLLPIVEKLSVEYKDHIEIRKINVDQNSELSAQFQIRSIPALFFIKDAKVVDKITGLAQESQLIRFITKNFAYSSFLFPFYFV
ncbi:thioredoxin [Aquimarina sp. RZ0]|uniref:thioredoxin n=1 Tax=Aquimarina sp. RZ0 TaxID=2607730 RepID=UPI0011F2C714|nr:thioredoxin [Aquimarina sp. RZ0]KAA1245198.1 thioredoxin [Aquimarina sp. RZ0]